MEMQPHPTIVMTPPMHTVSSQIHPRRPPAHRSVSLLHSPKRRLPVPNRSDSSSDGNTHEHPRVNAAKANDSPSSLQPFGRDSSGESSNAEKWFDKSNNNVRDRSASYVDNEPPFFMRNSSSSETPPEHAQHLKRVAAGQDGSNSLQLQAGLLNLGNDASSTDEFRGVIDDLTIENKKLKRRLKRYERLHDSHLKDEKLFEVRIHGLPPHKKRELEDSLRKFAASLGPTDGGEFLTTENEGILSIGNKPKIPSSQTSAQNADSAYASMSASGRGGSSARQSGQDSQYKTVAPSAASRLQNVRSYLHHIPEGLLPQANPATMTERAKKKLVVKRLEQIFAGKGAVAAGHQQPLQQQELSQIAARADRSALEAQGHSALQEGIREAFIMHQDSEEKLSSPEEVRADVQPALGVSERDFAEASAEPSTFEQRPTRPLDLDPSRAQVPADNIRYIRHLGFSPPDPESRKEPEDGHGWIYLNLLVGMAQLHTINVTTEFVRQALGGYSENFEISADGRKVRWKGGRRLTRNASDSSGEASNDRSSDDMANEQSPRKKAKLAHNDSMRTNLRGSYGGATQRSRQESKMAYTPMFFHLENTESSDDFSSEADDYGDESSFPTRQAGDSSGMTGLTSSGVRTISTGKKNRYDGPIIFYNNAKFCTDLSGERKPEGIPNAPPYSKMAVQPIGKPQHPAGPVAEKRGPLAEAGPLPEPMDIDSVQVSEAERLRFPSMSPMKSADRAHAKPIDFMVTGIGGVYPADNFAIDVQSRQARVENFEGHNISAMAPPSSLPTKFARILRGPESRTKARPAVVHKQVVFSRKQDLPPSELPPALGFIPSEDEMFDDDDSGIEDDVSILPESPGALPPSAAPQAIELPYIESDGDDDEDDGSGSDTNTEASLDLLAAAREVDPEAIRAREREYDANMAERLAEEIPAGSSAATAGGGSGFASPMNGVAREEYQRAKQAARAAQAAWPASIQRANTSDSLNVQGHHSSRSDVGEDDDDGQDAVSDIRS